MPIKKRRSKTKTTRKTTRKTKTKRKTKRTRKQKGAGRMFQPFNSSSSGVPPPTPNGGLTVLSEACNGPHCAIGVTPTVEGMSKLIKTSQLSKYGYLQHPGTNRSGNNAQNMPGIGKASVKDTNISCIKTPIQKGGARNYKYIVNPKNL